MRISKSRLALALIPALFVINSSIADDLDIYLGTGDEAEAADATRILFIMDESGSMNWPSGEPGVSRIEALKDATTGLLDANPVTYDGVTYDPLTGIQIGLAKFSSGQGEIIHPIVPIDDNRDSLKAAVNAMNPGGNTPLVAAYHEGFRYFRGLDKTPQSNSAASTYDSAGGTDTYISPGFASGKGCTKNIIIMLTDGDATSAAPQANLDSDTDFSTFMSGDLCPADEVSYYDDNGAAVTHTARVNNYGKVEGCGVSLARFAAETDFSDAPGKQNIISHTISFDPNTSDASRNYLQAIANTTPEGVYKEADSAATLRQVLNDLVGTVAEIPGSFSAPSVPVDPSNRLLSGQHVYMNLFQSEKRQLWSGNVKKFGLCVDGIGCTPGELMGKAENGAVVPATGPDRAFVENVGDLYSDPADYDADNPMGSAIIRSGGMGSLIEDWKFRKIYTWIYDDTGAPTDMFLVDRIDELAVPGNGGGVGNINNAVLRPYLKDSVGICANLDTDAESLCLDRTIKYMLGMKTQTEQPDGPVAGNRWALADVLHSNVITIPYGVDASGEQISKVLFGTNDGLLHMHDAKTGLEHFVVQLPETFRNLPEMEAHAASAEHLYGLDGQISVRLRDSNRDGVIDPANGEGVFISFGMRRGAQSYYSMDITPDAALTSHDADGIEPELMWMIDGENAAGTPYERLAQSWSTPQPAKILVDSGAANGVPDSPTVLIFGGGYDAEKEDKGFGVGADDSNLGNAIYIVNADTGELLWWTSSDASDTANSQKTPDMIAGIAADIRLVDSDWDRRVDRLYAVDLMGGVWRVDLSPTLTGSTVEQLASLGTDAGEPTDPTNDTVDRADERKFFYKPGWLRVTGESSTSGGTTVKYPDYNLITVVSGDRSNPRSEANQDRIYAIRDYQTDPIDGNYPKCNPEGSNCPGGFITEDHLMDVSSILYAPIPGSGTQSNERLALNNEHGWYFDLALPGEKGFGPTHVQNGILSFSTYAPPSVSEQDAVGQCSVATGKSYVYAVDLRTGSPVYGSWDGGTGISLTDRSVVAGDGPASELTPISVGGEAGAGGPGDPPSCKGAIQICSDGECPPQPCERLTFKSTFWYQD